MKKIFILFLVSFLLITCKKVAFDILYVDAPAVTTDSVNNIKLDSATVYFKINNPSNFKFVKVGVCYDTSTNNPNINNMVQLTDSGVVKGNLKIPIANLKYNTKYYARGFAIFNDSIFYGNVQTFTTNTLPTIALNINNITNSSASINWVITNNNKTNFTKVGVYYSISNMLPGTNNNDSTKTLINTGALSGTYILNLQNLITGSIYYIRYFYIINGVQYVSPQVQSFTAIILPTIATNTITNITKYTATTGITISNVGNVNITAAGLCYSKTNTIPTLADSLKNLANTGVLNGIYPIYLSNLTFNTVYYVRSYYTVNGLTYYGNVQNFTTLQNIPQVQTDTAINITNNSATIKFIITNETALNITAAGIAYSSSNTSPTTASGYVAHSSTGNLAGNYTLNLSSLSANTIYYYRAYINYNGTIYYGAVQTFTTTNLLTTLTLANLESNMVTVPAGSFTMGATNEQLANNGDGFSVFWSPTTQQVTLSTYKICRFEVTQQLWRDVMGNNPSYFNGGSYGTNLQRPVELVSWNDCQTFITKLNQLTGKSYRLPTEAEWEYVARGGLNSTYSYIYSGSNSLNDVAWNINNSSGQTQTVGTKQANALGLYDMTGNVWELCSDWYGNYSNTGVTNPQGPPTGTYRILRGGSFPNQSSLQRTSLRYSDLPTIRNYTLGFRLVLDNTILPTITTNAVTSITNSTATANINISNPIGLSITATGVAYSSSNSTPTTADAYIAHSSTGNLAGNYTLNLSSLSANTTYYVRAYINYNGTIYYGAVQTFTTLQNPPTITTNAVTSITNTTATGNINISNPNGLSIAAAGIVYSNINNIPTISDNFIAHSSIGNLAGNYTISLSSLIANTTYYVRAYINYNGTIYYGALQTFTTLQNPPTITTNAVTSITSTTATANINITNPNGLNITAAGVAYSSTNSTPTTANGYVSLSSVGNLAGNYTLGLSSLTVNTTYYVRGYINFNGTIYYGTVQTFTTTLIASIVELETNMVTVPAGSFTMGATSEQLANNGDGFSVFWSPTTQQVTLSTYKICRFEVTQQLWLDVMGSNPSYFTGNLQRPVESVSWNDCQTFISKLNQLTGKNYRLPTEAEWEYAARGGVNSTYSYIYSGGNTLNDVAWNGSNSSSQTQTIGTKQANALGLYDMTGNVWEWCKDWYGNYSNTAVTNPQGANSGSIRVYRGGSFGASGDSRVSNRGINDPSNRNRSFGIRLTFSSN